MATAAYSLRVEEVEHYTDNYFRFRLERPEGFRFTSGQFVMVGLIVDGKPLMRAYSIASPYWDEGLEFYSIIIPDGQLTSRLRHIKVGDHVALSDRAVGTLTLAPLGPGGKRLFMLSTGTGVAPFASLIRDDDIYDSFDEIYLTQTCRYVEDLQYATQQVEHAKNCPLVGEEAREKLHFYGSVTREPYEHQGRITHLIESGDLFRHLGIPDFDPETDRVLICGSMAMLKDTQNLLDKAGFVRGFGHRPAGYVWERAFSG
jgi:ferredoxin--NADP+ reductase